MDLFSKTVFGAIVLYFLFVIAATSDTGSGSGGFFSDLFGSKETIFLSKPGGDLGEVKSSRRIFNLGIGEKINLSAGKKQNKTIKKIQEEINIESSVLSEKHRIIEFQAPAHYDKIFMVFNVNPKFDSMGNLVIAINNKTIYSERPKNNTIFLEIPKKLIELKKNTLKISAEKSQNILGKTHYAIEDFKIKYETPYMNKVSFPIALENYEIKGWHSGKIKFVVEEAIRNSPLEIIINNNIICRKKPFALNDYEINFSNLEAKMMPKENELVFTTKPDSQYVLSNIHLIIKYYDTDTISKKIYNFNLLDRDIEKIKKNKAKLNFSIDKINLEQPIIININNFTETIENPQLDFYEIQLNETAFLKGKNIISFETTGAYKLRNIQISLE
ncbi:MAG: hypothetical protein B6U87_02820 [Candidatus Aenigmarchaeota archaeon ex4484_52]|nr:MAG: hypothetical protein B6U87_02820 [Candidatus Aenigmarchaeota archaeon ex4484_52]